MIFHGSRRRLSLRAKCLVRRKGESWFGGLAAQGGFTMVEIVVSIVVLSTASVALAGAMSTGYLGYRVLEKDMTALNLATAEMELTKGPATDYVNAPTTYADYVTPDGYKITVTAESVVGRTTPPNKLQRIIVTVNRNGDEVRKLEDYKADRNP